MSLNETPQVTQLPESHFIFIERIGSFLDTAYVAWQDLRKLIPQIALENKIVGRMSLFKFEPEMTYRAGVAVAEKPAHLPEGLRYEKFRGGKYTKFVITGSYRQLPEACGRVFEIVEEIKLKWRDEYCVEYYPNNPEETPEDDLITEVLIPTE